MLATAEIVGRGAELAELERFIDAIPNGAAAVAIEGQPGIGKTTLWRHGVQLARDGGFLVLAAEPVEIETGYAFAALGDLLAPIGKEILGALPAPQRRALEVALLLRDPGARPPDERAVAAAFLGVLRQLARVQPLVVAVDDVQWIDGSSARALGFAGRRLSAEPVGLLFAARSEEVSTVERLLPDTVARRLAVGPLSPGALQRLLTERLGTSFARPVLRRLHETAGGNPFFALELAAALRDREPLGPNEPLPVPGRLRQLVAARLERLSTPARKTLLAVSALARPTIEIVTEAVPSAPEGIADAVAAGVIEVTPSAIRVAHPLLASVVYAEASSDERRGLHHRLAGLVADTEERALHLAAAATGPDGEIARALEAAARRAKARGASDAAASLAEEALALTPSGANGFGRATEAAEYYFEAGKLDDATRILRAALAEAAWGPEHARLLVALGRVRHQAEGTHAAVALYREALVEAGDDLTLRSTIHQRLASVLFFTDGPAAAEPDAETALRLAEDADDPCALALALATAARVAFSLGRGVQHDLMARAVALEQSCPHLFFYDRPSVMLASQLNFVDEHERSRERWKRLIEQAHALDEPPYVPLYWLSLLEHRAGNWSRAAELAEECLSCAVEHGQDHWEAFGAHALAMVEAHRGDEERARAHIDRCWRVSDAAGQPTFVVGCRELLGFLALSLGDPREAREQLSPGYEALAAMGVQEPGRFFFLPDYLEALIAVGEMDEAERWLRWLEERGRTLDRPWALAAAGRCRGLFEAARGRNDIAIEALEAALDEHDRFENPFELGKTLLVLGRARRRANRRKAARETLQSALQTFEGLGAALWAEKARSELARIGGRAPSAGRLTPVEERIAALVAEGRTNREAAAALHLSERTVEGHLSRVYAKLGVRSRVELARALPLT